MKFLIAFLTIIALTSCSSYKPILDQNSTYLQNGEETAKQDIDECTKNADAYLKQYKMRRAAKEAGRKAIIGSVIGAVTGVLFGNTVKSLATGAVIGAGIGAAAGGLGVAGEDKVSPDHIKQNYVSNCLARKGYSVIGWE